MSHAGIAGMRSATGDLVDIGRGIDDAEWQTPSAAAGWSVRDVISHIGCLLELLQAAVRGEAVPDSGIEPLNDAMVAERRRILSLQVSSASSFRPESRLIFIR